MEMVQGEYIAIAGGASGIGRATAQLLWKRGSSLAVADINSQGLKDLENELLGSTPQSSQQVFFGSIVDVTQPQDVTAWIEEFKQKTGRLDGAVNVAGMTDDGGLLAEKTDAHFDFTIELNLRGVFNCMRAELNNMSQGASIVNVSSMAGVRGFAGVSVYSGAKHAVNGMTKSAAIEYGAKGIRINSVCPGLVRTPALEAPVSQAHVSATIQRTPLGRWAEPREVASLIAFLLSDEASYMTGAVVSVDGGLSC